MKILIAAAYLLGCLHAAISYPGGKAFRQLEGRSLHTSPEDERWTRTKRQTQDEGNRIICYYASWSINRTLNKFTPEDIDAQLCTHIIYDYARPELKEGLVPWDTYPDVDEKLWQRITALKQRNTDLKVFLGVGGIRERSARFSKLSADPAERQIFVKSAGSTLREFGFDGLDMSWFFPGILEGSSPSDKQNYVKLLQELKEEFGNSYSLVITIPAFNALLDAGYDLPEIINNVEHVNLWAGAYHIETDSSIHHPAPLYNVPYDESTKELNVDSSVQSVLSRGVPASMLNLIIPSYGLYFILEDSTKTTIGSPADEEGKNREWQGSLNFNDICLKVIREGWTVERINSSAIGPYAYKDLEWIGYDDDLSVKAKARYAKEQRLGGVGFWTVDMDDFKGACYLETYPLLRAARQSFLSPSPPNTSTEATTTAKLDERIFFPKK